ncbi:hypothetical protein JCM16303_006340 [Sporobolomyces ruberrimus]
MPPRRQRGGNNAGDPANQGAVYGPRSALTSFLREQGITGPGAGFSGRITRPDSNATATPPTPTDSTSEATTPVTLTTASTPQSLTDDQEIASPVASTSTNPIASGSGSSPLVASTSSSASKRKTSATKNEAAMKKQKKVEEEGFMLAGKPQVVPKKGRYENRMPGSIAVCAECGKKFTVSKYTASNPNGDGILCGACTSESIEDRATFPSAGGKAKGSAAAKKPVKKKAQKSLEETLYKPVVTLQQCCLSVIGQYINDVEALGDLGPANLDRVAKIVCKNRALTSENIKLFLEVGHRELRLYDCTNVRDTELASISIFCPHLERLTLNLCGRLDDDVLTQWEKGFDELKHLALYAPYLVTPGKWKEFFEKRHEKGFEFETFQLRMSSRFNELSLISLVATNPNLVKLKLSEIGRFTGDSLEYLYPLKGKLRSLDISRLGTPQGTVLEDDDVIGLLREIGEELDELNLDGNCNLTDRVLVEGVKKYCPHLRILSLSELGEIEPHGFETLFSDKVVEREGTVPPLETNGENGGEGGDQVQAQGGGEQQAEALTTEPSTEVAQAEEPFTRWSSPGLTHLNLHRLTHLTPQSLLPLLSHSGHSLLHLSLHSLDELDTNFLFLLAEKCPKLEILDVSFVRSVDNFVVGKIWEGCKEIKTLFVHGNNRVTSEVPRKKDAQLRGLENAIHSEIPSGVTWEN